VRNEQVPTAKAKICSVLYGNVERAAEMTAPDWMVGNKPALTRSTSIGGPTAAATWSLSTQIVFLSTRMLAELFIERGRPIVKLKGHVGMLANSVDTRCPAGNGAEGQYRTKRTKVLCV
jgi:hypothetical protein